jgi:GT2 family glycosyltransferase
MLKIRAQTIRDIYNYYQLHGAIGFLRHGFEQLSLLNSRESGNGILSILATHFIENERKLAFYHDPLVSIIVCNKDGIRHLPALCDALDAQAYRHFEIIFVDNASTDESTEYFLKRFPNAQIIKLNTNLGFAAANNIGYLATTGELVALLNNDTVPEHRWLSELVEVLRMRPLAACAVPKLLFNRFFSEITIRCTQTVFLGVTELIRSLDYPKAFVYGREIVGQNDLLISGDTTLLIPAQDSTISFCFHSTIESVARILILRGGQAIYSGNVDNSSALRIEVSNSWTDGGHWRRVINNAGSTERFFFEPADRGYGEVDRGQFEEIVPVDYLCGCAAVLKRAALKSDLLFRPEFFAYFEDSELSIRLRRGSGQIIYAPRSVVLHTHSATAGSNPEYRKYLVDRNRVVFKYLRSPALLRRLVLTHTVFSVDPLRDSGLQRLSLFRALYSMAKVPKMLSGSCGVPAIRDAMALIGAGFQPIVQTRLRVCIYNEYWNSCGGGEAHALEFARNLFSDNIELTLASGNTIDVRRLSRLFDFDLQRIVLLIKPGFCSADTKQFDLFINSTYQSTLVSQAKHSIFVVSFPSRRSSSAFLDSYFFAYNSEFTSYWSSKYWGKANGMIIEPVVCSFSGIDVSLNPNKLILSVGRFSNRGHAKNQHCIAKAFIAANRGNPNSDWHLALVGTLDHTSRDDVAYYQEIVQLSKGHSILVIEGATHEEVKSLYLRAKVYVHAVGIGVDEQKHPELTEHFGMTVAEAINAGCYVIVHNSGNPPFLLRSYGFGAVYTTASELVERLRVAIQGFDDGTFCKVTTREDRFTRVSFNERLSSALTAIGFHE